MTNFRKKAIALAAVACFAVTSAASCTKKEADSNVSSGSKGSSAGSSQTVTGGDNLEHIENESGAVVVTPFQSGSPDDLIAQGLSIPAPDVDLDSDDPVSGSQKEPTTEIVEATEANGEKATDAQGQVVTQIVTAPADTSADYVSKTESRYCLWIDISKDSDYVFNDDFIEIVFKLKEDIPDKDYPVRFNPDLSTIAGRSVTPDKVIQGNIRVGGDIEPQDVSSETGFVAYGDNVSAKAGDEVSYFLNLKNNPGLAAMLVWVYYDSNAMDVEAIIPSGEFAAFAQTSSGSKPQS